MRVRRRVFYLVKAHTCLRLDNFTRSLMKSDCQKQSEVSSRSTFPTHLWEKKLCGRELCTSIVAENLTKYLIT